MHDGQLFVIAMMAVAMLGGIGKTWVRARHGLPDNSRRFRRALARRHRGYDEAADDLDNERKVRLLSDENEKLVGKIGRLEERLAVLERIATDPAERTAREIEALRDR